jgi:hypothetical protein
MKGAPMDRLPAKLVAKEKPSCTSFYRPLASCRRGTAVRGSPLAHRFALGT